MRIQDHHPSIMGAKRGSPCQITIDGHRYEAFLGETIATVLLANGRIPSPDLHANHPGLAGFYCGIGICYGCQVLVDNRPQRACVTPVYQGMEITTVLEPPA